MKNTSLKSNRPKQDLYSRQNSAIHEARAQLAISLDDCRELARSISGKASISSLSFEQRWKLIEILKTKGADVYNPPLSEAPISRQGKYPAPVNNDSVCSGEEQENPEDVYFARFDYWEKRFPKSRSGYASNKQLAWIQSLWELNFEDGHAGANGLRGFIYRQTVSLENGPVSDLAFLRDHHVEAVITPLKLKARQRNAKKTRS